mgnify:CR=1 FL=1
MKKPKKGDRYLNHLGEYCIIKSIYRGVIKLQICGDKPRIEPWKMNDFINHLSFTFFKVPFPKTNRENIARHLLEYQLNIIGKTTTDTKKDPKWFDTWEISKEEVKLFESYAISALKKVFRFNTIKAKQTFTWFNLQFGLKLKK